MASAEQVLYQNKALRVIAIIREEAMQGGIRFPSIALDNGSPVMKGGDHQARLTASIEETALVVIKSAWFESADAASELELRRAIREVVKTLL